MQSYCTVYHNYGTVHEVIIINSVAGTVVSPVSLLYIKRKRRYKKITTQKDDLINDGQKIIKQESYSFLTRRREPGEI